MSPVWSVSDVPGQYRVLFETARALDAPLLSCSVHTFPLWNSYAFSWLVTLDMLRLFMRLSLGTLRIRWLGWGIGLWLTSCQPSDSSPVQTDRQPQTSQAPKAYTIRAEAGHAYEQRIFDERRGRFSRPIRRYELWNEQALINPQAQPDGSVSGFLSLYPLTLVNIKRATIGDPVTQHIDAWPMSSAASCPTHALSGTSQLQALGHGSPALHGTRISEHYVWLSEGSRWLLGSSHCWTNDEYVLRGSARGLDAADLGRLHYVEWDPHRPLSYGTEVETTQAEALFTLYRPNTIDESQWLDWLEWDQPRALAAWNEMMDNFVQPDGGPIKTALPVTRLRTASEWVPEVLLHESFRLYEMQSRPTMYVGELLDTFITPMERMFYGPTWHHRIAIPFPAVGPIEYHVSTLEAIWFEASAYLLGRIWETTPESIFHTYGGLPIRDDVEQLEEDLKKIRDVRQRLTFSEPDPSYWQDNKEDIDDYWLQLKQASLIAMRLDLIGQGRIAIEIRAATNKPDLQFQIIMKIIEYLNKSEAPIAFSPSAKPEMAIGVLSFPHPSFRTPQTARIMEDASIDAFERLAELALFKGDTRLSPVPFNIVRRFLVPLMLWENHAKLLPFRQEVLSARATYETKLLAALDATLAANLGTMGEARPAELVEKANAIMIPLRDALHEWAKAVKLSQRI